MSTLYLKSLPDAASEMQAYHPHHPSRGGVPHGGALPPSRGPLLPLPPGYSPHAPQGMHTGESGGPKKFAPPHRGEPMSLGELSTGVSSLALADLAPRVKALGFPASCSFVFGLLERFVMMWNISLEICLCCVQIQLYFGVWSLFSRTKQESVNIRQQNL